MSQKRLLARRDKETFSSVQLGLFSPIQRSARGPTGAHVTSSPPCTLSESEYSQSDDAVQTHTLSNGSNSFNGSNDQHVHQPERRDGNGKQSATSGQSLPAPPARPLPLVVLTWGTLLVALARQHMPFASPRRLLAVFLCYAFAWLVMSCVVDVPSYARSSVGEQTFMMLASSLLPPVDRFVCSSSYYKLNLLVDYHISLLE